MNEDPRSVSVVIPAFNASRYLAGTVKSVLDQTCPPREVIVVDDGSTDDTAAITTGFGDAITLVRQDNAGACVARNRGIAMATGRYVAFLDADDIWVPEKLERQTAILDADPALGAVHCDASRLDATDTPLMEPPRARKQRADGDVFFEFFEASISVILTSTVMIRRSCFDNMGIFDDGGDVVDDHDFFLRLAAQYPIAYIHEPLLHYRVLPGSLSRLRTAERVEQHAETLRRAIAAYSERFTNMPPRYLKQRWKSFHRWAGMMLYYQGEYATARVHLRKVLFASPRVLPHYLLSYLRGKREGNEPRRLVAPEGRM